MAGHVNTSMPGQVVSFDRDNQTVSVRPCFQRKYFGLDDSVELAIISDVPIVLPGSGDRWITCDIKIDSYVILVFSQRSLAVWLNSGGVVDPAQARKFHLSDAVAIPGPNPFPDSLEDVEVDEISMRTRDNKSYIRINTDTDIELAAGAGESTSSLILDAYNGRITLNEGTGTAIEFARMKTAFDELTTKFNLHIGKYNLHVHGLPGTPPTTLDTPTTADMSLAESNKIKIP